MEEKIYTVFSNAKKPVVIIRNGIEIELSYEELQQAVAEYEQREHIFATQKWTLGDIEDILISDEDVESYTDEDIQKISALAKEELENCSDNSEFIQNIITRYFREKLEAEQNTVAASSAEA